MFIRLHSSWKDDARRKDLSQYIVIKFILTHQVPLTLKKFLRFSIRASFHSSAEDAWQLHLLRSHLLKP